MKLNWTPDNRIKIDPPKRTKKCTGTRFATLLGLNPWSTAFEMWCAITKTYEVPFEDTPYTKAGKIIEPKQAEYMKRSYGMDIITPTDRYGKDYFKKTWGDFFPEDKIFGGMWDYLGVNEETEEVDTVLEMKTTKRIEDWENDIPEYYALQAALYAYLLGVDNVIMVASFLEPSDYDHPEDYTPNINNTITREFKVSERYPHFIDKINYVEEWWKDYVLTGTSPQFDETKDAEILKALRTNSLSPETNVTALVKAAETLKLELDTANALLADKEKRLKQITEQLKEVAKKSFRDGDTKVEIKGSTYGWTLSKSESTKTVYNDEALRKDGLYDKYVTVKTEPSYRMTISKIKGDE